MVKKNRFYESIQRLIQLRPVVCIPPKEVLQKIISSDEKDNTSVPSLAPRCFHIDTKIELWPTDIPPDRNGKWNEQEILARTFRKSIKEIALDDLVLSYDENGNLFPGRVTNLYQNIADEWLELKIVDPNNQEQPAGQTLYCTPGHSFLNADGSFEPIGEMLARDGGITTIVLRDGSLGKVIGKSIIYTTISADLFEQAEGYVFSIEGDVALQPEFKKGWRTYNFEVEELHTHILPAEYVCTMQVTWPMPKDLVA